ncbi:BRO1-domain-containing protein [Artomyces pyxidatus]|uniref:BRO1-domain-containing protein n=1 Tax=Artomyces pyxidatus TaxID=48021 RepID=A0ACB8T9B2_9AGAM|nr:BRO1-domain-containing protein [Artomyces pyxidatus]
MPNQISIPSKKTYSVPLKQAVYNHIQSKHPDTHPEAFKWDISRWESLRKAAVGGTVHVDRVNAIIGYHAQLVFALTKLPADIGLEIPYATVFSPPNALPVTLSNLHYERCSILFNLAALYSQLATSEDRSNSEGVKRASAFYQASSPPFAAGTFSYLLSTALPSLRTTIGVEELPLDLSEALVRSCEWLVLAQAQECAWQLAVLGHKSNGVISRLAAQVSILYESALSTIREATPSIRHLFPTDWLPYLETKQLHFDAAAQYRKGIDDIEHNRYGHELARLTSAQATAKRGYDVARRGAVPAAVQQDVKSLLDIVETNFTRAQRDNDLIYHQDVPALSALPNIQPVLIAQSTIPSGLQDPKTVLGDEAVIFGELLSWGARMAIEIYKDRQRTLVTEEIIDQARELRETSDRTLRSLNLPAALEALDKPVGLPPSLLSKAEEVRLDNGPQRIEKSIDDVQMLAKRAQQILDDAYDILDQEASEDEKLQEEIHISRLPSHQANEDLTSKGERYRTILREAFDSDEVVRQRWDEWETNIVELTYDEATLEASVPSSTTLTTSAGRSGTTETQTHARALRVLLEQLDDISRDRELLVSRAERLADADDITPRVLKAAAAVERWVDVQPSMFEDLLDEELSKYDKFRNDIQQGGVKQEEILAALKTRTETFLSSRKEDPSIKDREHALQSLDLAYHKYKEIIRHLDEGLQASSFYNDLSAILMQFKETCKEWKNLRHLEMQSLTGSIRSMSLKPEPSSPAPSHASLTLPDVPSSPPFAQQKTPARPKREIAMDLPSPDSAQWQAVELPPPPSRSRPTRQGQKN